MKTISCGLSDVGKRRQHNEDAYLCDDDLQLYVVADGVGGHAKGEVASKEAVEQVQIWVLRHRELVEDYRAAPSEKKLPRLRRMLESGVQSACYMVYGMAELDPSQKGMSTTLSTLLVIGDMALVAQVGDSRVYLFRDRWAVQITEDHTLLNYKLKQGLLTPEQAKQGRGKNIITRAVGHMDYVQVDTFDLLLRPKDRFMLCSDGLHDYLKPGEVEAGATGTLLECAKGFIDLANERGGKDNITCVLVEVE